MKKQFSFQHGNKLLLLLFLITGNALQAQKPEFRFVNELHLRVHTERDAYTISHIPGNIRYVPIHRKDEGVRAQDNDVIPTGTVESLPGRLSLNYRASVAVRTELIEFCVGGNIDWRWLSFSRELEDKDVQRVVIREYDHSSATNRGTYYGAPRGGIFEAGPFVRLAFMTDAEKYERFGLFFEGSLDFSHLCLENGWYRDGTFKKHETYAYADAMKKTLIIGLERVVPTYFKDSFFGSSGGGFMRIYLGWSALDYTPNTLGKQLVIEAKNSFFIWGFSGGCYF